VSPHNVLVSEQGEVKLTDFGIAKAMGRREHTGHGVIKGKLAFMSPEQASGLAVDARSDLFSLGTVLYVLGTGQRPFEAPTDLEALMRVRHCQFAPPEEVAPAISPEFARITLRAMQAAPADRYQSAEEMLIDIEAVQRSVFVPAGQTELKRWLAELQQIDGAPTISKASIQIPATGGSEAMQFDDNQDVIFDDSSQIVEPLEGPVRPTQPTVAVTPALPPTVSVSAPKLSQEKPAKTSRRLALFFLLGGAAAWLGWLKTRDPPQPERKTAPPASAPSPPTPPRSAPGPPPPAQTPPLPSLAPPAPAKPAEIPGKDAQVAESEEIRPPPRAQPTEDEEEILLEHSEPSASDQVLGEAEGEGPAAPPTARLGGRAKPERTLPDNVSVHIESRPNGAVVKLRDRVFGRSPLNLRFRPGIAYQLTFVKKGYQSASKRFTVTGRKNQRVTITLNRKPGARPSPKKSLFRRIFGR
jgi:hypothetical protein